MRLVIAIHLREADLGAQLVRLLARQAAVGKALGGEAEQGVGRLVCGKLVAADAIGVEGVGAGLQGKQHRRGFARLLGVAIDAGNLGLCYLGRVHRVVELRAALLHDAELLRRRLLTELDARLLEGGKHAAGIDVLLGVLSDGVVLRHLDALLGGLLLALVLGELAVDGRQFLFDLRDTPVSGVETLLGVLDPVVLDLEGGLHLAKLVHALAIDGALAFLQRAFDALVLGHRLDALGIDGAGARVELGFRRRVVGGECRAVSLDARELVGERRLLAGDAGLAALGGDDTLLLLLDAAVARFDLVVEVFLDLPRRALRGGGELVELGVIGAPAFALEQRFRLHELLTCNGIPDVGDDAGHLVLRAHLGDALALVLREHGVEAAVEGEEHRRRHAGEEHHPQHGILGDDAQRLRIGRDDVGAGEDGEQAEPAEDHACGGQPLNPEVGRDAVAHLVEEGGGGEKHDGEADDDDKRCGHAGEPAARRRAHAGRKALTDQPGDDQHHAVDAESEHERQHRLPGEVRHAVPGGPAAGERQHDRRRAEHRKLPVGEEHFLDDAPQPRADLEEHHDGGENRRP